MRPFVEGVRSGDHGARFETIAELGVLVTGLGELRDRLVANGAHSSSIGVVDAMSGFASDIAGVTTEVLSTPEGESFLNDESPVALDFPYRDMTQAAELAVRLVAFAPPSEGSSPDLTDSLRQQVAETMAIEYAQEANRLGLAIPGYNVGQEG
jgi:hypothetical protein